MLCTTSDAIFEYSRSISNNPKRFDTAKLLHRLDLDPSGICPNTVNGCTPLLNKDNTEGGQRITGVLRAQYTVQVLADAFVNIT